MLQLQPANAKAMLLLAEILLEKGGHNREAARVISLHVLLFSTPLTIVHLLKDSIQIAPIWKSTRC
jgi:hypothetical protein